MDDQKQHLLHPLLFLLVLSQTVPVNAWSLFSSDDRSTETPPDNSANFEFSMVALNNPKGVQLVEDAKNKMTMSNSCWQNSYRNLFAGCDKILGEDETKSRLAWHLSDCFHKESGRTPFPYCDAKSIMKTCLKKLDDNAHSTYLAFFVQTNSICHQLQLSSVKIGIRELYAPDCYLSFSLIFSIFGNVAELILLSFRQRDW